MRLKVVGNVYKIVTEVKPNGGNIKVNTLEELILKYPKSFKKL